MSARSGLVGKNPPGPVWGHLGQFFAWAEKIGKMQNFRLFLLFYRFGALAAIHPRWCVGMGAGSEVESSYKTDGVSD